MNLHPSPRAFSAFYNYPKKDCVEVEVRFRTLIEAEAVKGTRMNGGTPAPELIFIREQARQSLLGALAILRDTLQQRASQGLFGAPETLEDQVWIAGVLLKNREEPAHYAVRRATLERAVRIMDHGARHLDLPPDFWRAMLMTVNHLGLVRQHRRYEKLVRSTESAQNQVT